MLIVPQKYPVWKWSPSVNMTFMRNVLKKTFGKRLDCLTASFNNMRILKFKIQPTVTLFTAVNH